jgi:mevalonate kinase
VVAVSAPGKLILMGEHGAVYGVPALTAALGLRARVELETAAEGGVELDLPDLGVRAESDWQGLTACAERARRRWQEFRDGAQFERDEDPAALVRVALGEAAGVLGRTQLPPLRLRVRSQLPVGAGFGSSAAVAVAIIAGLLAWRGTEPDAEVVGRLALEVERRQHGMPSGVDHGTVLLGGVQWASRNDDGELGLEPVAARPELLRELRIYDSGRPAESTGTVVAAVAAHRRHDPTAFDLLLARMRAAVTEFRAVLETGESGDMVPEIRLFERCLEEIGVVPSPVHEAVHRLEQAGGAAKISGAGALSGAAAGCLLVCFPPHAAAVPEPAGWRRIDTMMGAVGLQLEAA